MFSVSCFSILRPAAHFCTADVQIILGGSGRRKRNIRLMQNYIWCKKCPNSQPTAIGTSDHIGANTA